LVELGLESGLKQLEDDHHRVRREALLLVAHLTPTDPANAVHAQAILSRFTSDTDFRVRMVHGQTPTRRPSPALPRPLVVTRRDVA
jgi:hypothetical protein